MKAKVIEFFKKIFSDTYSVCLTLFKIIVPLSFAVKVLEDLGCIEIISRWLEPLMSVVGLPGSTGFVWATAMTTSIYGGIVVFANLAPTLDLTIAQCTVLATMILVAHSLPIEIGIARKAGVRVWASLIVRMVGAVVFGVILNSVYTSASYLQERAKIDLIPVSKDPSWQAWFFAEFQRVCMITLIIFCLLFILAVFKVTGINKLISILLKPLLSLIKISEEACQLVIIGMLMGLGYGGGLIIKESEQGTIKPKDIFCALMLLNLCHSVIEDTLLLMVIGGHVSGILWGRMALTLIIMFFFTRIIAQLSDERFRRFFWAKG